MFESLSEVSHEEHRQQLELLFNRLRNTNLKVNLPKCKFGADNVSYLGFRLTPDGILPGSPPVPPSSYSFKVKIDLCKQVVKDEEYSDLYPTMS